MKFLTALAFFAVWLIASEVEIVAKRFEGDEKSGVSKFFGDVKVTRGDDVITADSIFVYFDKAKNPLRFEAQGNALFKSKQDGKSFNGSAETIRYEAAKKEYVLNGNAFVEYVEEKRKVYGEQITVSDLTKKASVVGNSGKPARFIFQLDDKKTSTSVK